MTENPERLAVYGAGGLGREVAWLAQTCFASDGRRFEVVCFVDDAVERISQELNGVPVMSLGSARAQFPSVAMVVAVGAPSAREALVRKALQYGFRFDSTLIHQTVVRSPWVEIGVGTVICAGCSLTTNIVVREHVVINPHCTIGHDAVIGQYATLAPGVRVSGWVHIGKRVFVGAGAVIVNGSAKAPLVIGDDAVIGASACVLGSVEADVTVVGVPARPMVRV